MTATDTAQATGVHCPICDGRFPEFEPTNGRAGVVCPSCSSRERHRTLALLLRERPGLLADARSLLHFAPERCLADIVQAEHLRYITADIDPRRADLPIDLMDVKLPDDAFDAILCSHVLEHVPDDAVAMRELHRITRPGGWMIVMVPLDLYRDETYEDPSIVDPAERRKAFRQEDHVRLYALDIADRLRAAGFDVEDVARPDAVGEEGRRRHGLLRSDHVFVCVKPR